VEDSGEHVILGFFFEWCENLDFSISSSQLLTWLFFLQRVFTPTLITPRHNLDNYTAGNMRKN